jgi:hypothetical protein
MPPEFQYSRASTGTYVGSDGLIKTARAGEPRFDCDPLTGNVKGLLIQPTSSNFTRNSQSLNSWQSVNGMLVESGFPAPDGSNTAFKLTQTIAGNNSYILSTNTGFTGGSMSVFFKKGNTRYANYMNDHGIDLDTGTFAIAAGGFYLPPSGSYIEKYPNGWYRICCVNVFSGFVPFPQWRFSPAGEFVYVWGAQTENVAFPTSYIPTTTTAVTRAADILTVPTSTFLNTSKSSIVVESETTINDSPVISLNDGTTFNETKLIVYPTAGVSKLVTNDIVRSGLVLNLDAGNPASYSGSGTTWTDLSGNGNNGTLVNGVGYNGSNLGSLSFDGVDDYVNLGNASSLNILNQLTISSWILFVNSPNPSGNPSIVDKWDYNNNRRSYVLGTENGSLSTYVSYDGSFGNRIVCTDTAPSLNVWINLVMTYDNQTLRLYKNSSFITSSSYNQVRNLYDNQPTSVYLMSNNALIPNTTHLSGNIAQVSIYNRALTAAEISQNYNALKSRYI